jgi:hypothetical protein
MALIREAEELLGNRDLTQEVRGKILKVIQDSEHWKSNHKDMVSRCALLSQRPDVPVDRIPAYRELIRLQERVRQLEKMNAEYKQTLIKVCNERESS